MKSFLLAAFAAAVGSSLAACTGLDLGGTKGCICPSGEYYTGAGSCSANPVCQPNLLSTFPTTANTTFDSSGMNLTTIDMTGYDMDVTLRLDVPAMQTRKYINVYIAGPNAEPLANCDVFGNVFKNVSQIMGVVVGPGLRCQDVMNFAATFADLRGCGFAVSNLVDTASSGYQTWDGTIRLVYNETVTVGTGSSDYTQDLSRNATIDFPFRLQFKSQETFNMTMSNITVYAKQQIDFVILSQTIPRDGSSPSAILGYTVQYPYAITGWLNGGALAKVAAGSPANQITAAMAALAPVCSTTDYIAAGANTGGNCYKAGMQVLFTKGSPTTDCRFSGQTYQLGFNVRCATGLADTDCPLQEGDVGNTTFTITSDNWCTSAASAQTINNVIRMDTFYSAQSQDWTKTQNAFRVNDRAYFVITFTGLLMNTITLTKLERIFVNLASAIDTTPYATVADATSSLTDISVTGLLLSGSIPPLVSGQVGSLETSPLTTGGNLGKGTDDLSYYFSALMNDDLLGTGATAGIVRGADWFLKLRATVDVTYNTTTNARRRRRQADSAGSGSIESNQQSIAAAETAEAAPSPAVRSVPAFALALAALAAVMIM